MKAPAHVTTIVDPPNMNDPYLMWLVNFSDGETAGVSKHGLDGFGPSHYQWVYVVSKSTPDTSYKVQFQHGKVQKCECQGFTHRGYCRHLSIATVAMESVKEHIRRPVAV